MDGRPCYQQSTAASIHHLVGGAKKISESSLLERNSFSISGVVLNVASSTAGEIAFHTKVLPAKWLKIRLHKTRSRVSIHNTFFSSGLCQIHTPTNTVARCWSSGADLAPGQPGLEPLLPVLDAWSPSYEFVAIKA